MEAFFTFAHSIRRKFARTLTKFYTQCLLPENGINNENEDDIEVEYSSLRKMGWLEIAQAIERLNVAGAFRDDNEVRRATQLLFEWVKPLPEGENKKREYATEKELAKVSKPLQGGSTPAAGSSQKNPQNKRAVVTK